MVLNPDDTNDVWEATEEPLRARVSEWDIPAQMNTNKDLNRALLHCEPSLVQVSNFVPASTLSALKDYRHIRHGTKPERAVYNSGP